jgi:hypothetical protein
MVLRASRWYCGDEVCDCSQYQIEHVRVRCSGEGYEFERVWEGKFISGTWELTRSEKADLLRAFRAAAHDRGIELKKDNWGNWSGEKHFVDDFAHSKTGEPLWPSRPRFGYRCDSCGYPIKNPNPGDYLFCGGPLDGQWIATDGRSYILAADPLPVSFVLGDPEPRLTFRTVTYVRDYRPGIDRYWLDG